MKYVNELITVLSLYKKLNIKIHYKNIRSAGGFDGHGGRIMLSKRFMSLKATNKNILDLIAVLLHELGHAVDHQTKKFKTLNNQRSMNEKEFEAWANQIPSVELSADRFARDFLIKLKLPTTVLYYLENQKTMTRGQFKVFILRNYGIYAVRVK